MTRNVCPRHGAAPGGVCTPCGHEGDLLGPATTTTSPDYHPLGYAGRPAPDYVYVASSWRNPRQADVVAALKRAEIGCYDFRNPPGGTGFSWREVKSDYDGPRVGTDGIRAKGSDWEQVDEYLRMVAHPRAVEGYAADFAAMQRADTFVMVLPCGKSAHLEIGYAIGAGRRTAILLEDPVEPELMYRGADFLARDLGELLAWMGAA